MPRALIHVVPNAIDPDRVKLGQPGAVRCAFRNRLGLEPSDLVGLFVGHNFALKGLKPLLQALGARSQARGARPIHLLVCGGGRSAAYRRMARALGLDATVHFLGYHDDIRECYASSDFFVMPTYYDPCSLVVLEALACGLPVITTAQNGASELMTDGRQGYVLTAPDAQGELVAALDHMTDDARRRAMSAEAARLGGEQTFDRHVAALLKVFQDVAAARNSHGSHGRNGGSRPHGAASEGQAESRALRAEPTRGGPRARPGGHGPLDPGRGHATMKAVLLAGGKGTRLRPYTHVLPKPLMPLGEADPMPIIEVVLRQLARFGFRDVTIITGYLTELIEAFCGDGRKFGTRLRYRREETPLGTAGGLTLLKRPAEPVLVINGDILTTLNYGAMYEFHRARGAAATIASYPREVKIDFGVLEFGDDPHVLTGYREKPEYSFQVSMGVYLLDPLAWDFLTPGEPLTMPELLESMRAQRPRDPLLPPALLLARHRPPRRLRHGQRDLRGPPGGLPGRARPVGPEDRARPVSWLDNIWIQLLIGSLAGYLIGAIPFGYLVYRGATGTDIRTVGSGNIGATNVGRLLGFRYFLLVFALDVLKGFAPGAGRAPGPAEPGRHAARRSPVLRRPGRDPRTQLPGLSRLQGGQGRGHQPGGPAGARAALLRGRGGRLLRRLLPDALRLAVLDRRRPGVRGGPFRHRQGALEPGEPRHEPASRSRSPAC